MKQLRWFNLLFVLLFLSACGRGNATATLSTPQITTTRVPSTEAAMRAYLEAQLVEDYASMYAMLTQASRAGISQEDFSAVYKDALAKMSVSQMEYSIQSTLTNPHDAQAAFHLTYHTVLFGDLQRDMVANFRLEDGQWHLQWDPGLILPELAGGNKLQTDYRLPARGDIYDRSGNPVVVQADAVALGLEAGQVPPDQEDALFTELWRLTGVRPEIIRRDYEAYPAGQYVPVGEASQKAVNARMGVLSALGGWLEEAYNSRYSYLSSQAVGYIQAIFPEELEAFRRLGYSGGERIGRIGVEKWGEQYLHGKNGASLYLVDASGKVSTTIARADAQPADSIYLTIDRDLQEQAQQAMDGLPGAIVVMEVGTGRVLAMVSSPGLDANLFDQANYNSINLKNVVTDPAQPFLNRATQGAYPLGSVFKIVSMAAALESGMFTPESTWDCQYDYTELVPSGGPVLHDWTWMHCQDQQLADPNFVCNTSSTRPSGVLTLPQGLMRSCDPWFYHIGFTLFNQDKGNLIPDMASAFGLGKITGIDQVAEVPGSIPAAPSDGTNATSIAIGQGGVLVTPLQVAAFIAAIGNGGTLYRPQLVEKVQPVSGDPLYSFKPQASGTLPISPENLQVIQEAMRSVSENTRGTAYSVLGTFAIPTAAKTGTAESGTAEPHAWFAGYSLANRPDKPDIAVVVVVNNQGEGATYALPIFRRVMEIYFYGHPQYIYRWESNIGVIRPTETPTPAP